MDKEDVVPIYNGVLLSHKKEQNNGICSNMDGLSEVSQTQKDKWTYYFFNFKLYLSLESYCDF